MTREDAIKWYEAEVDLLKAAPALNGCEMTKEWAEQIEVHSMALAALREYETLCQYNDNGFCRRYSTLDVAYPCKGDGECEGMVE